MLYRASSLDSRQSLTGCHGISLESPRHCSNLLIEIAFELPHLFDEIAD